MMPPNVVFMGTPEPVLPVLAAIEELKWPIVAVYTAPDSMSRRGKKVQRSPVKEYAYDRGLLVRDPVKPSAEDEIRYLRELNPDLVVLAAYGKILPQEILAIPRLGSINIHPSLLPRHRGAAPVAAAILEGDAIAGTSLLIMDEGIDTGPIVAAQEIPLMGTERTPELTRTLFALGAQLLMEYGPQYVAGALKPIRQTEDGVTFVRRHRKEDGILEWNKPAEILERQIRAYEPWPGSATWWCGLRLEVMGSGVSHLKSPTAAVGTVVRLQGGDGRGIGVVTGSGVLFLTKVKLEGKGATAIEEFARGYPQFIGSILPS